MACEHWHQRHYPCAKNRINCMKTKINQSKNTVAYAHWPQNWSESDVSRKIMQPSKKMMFICDVIHNVTKQLVTSGVVLQHQVFTAPLCASLHICTHRHTMINLRPSNLLLSPRYQAGIMWIMQFMYFRTTKRHLFVKFETWVALLN